MAPKPSPWYWPERKGWYTIVHSQRQFLGDHPAGAAPPQKRKGKWIAPSPILQAFHKLMASKPEPPLPKAGRIAVIEVFDKYLDWCKMHRADHTYEWYHGQIQGFINHSGSLVKQPAADLKPSRPNSSMINNSKRA
jgi:hypothetical protein